MQKTPLKKLARAYKNKTGLRLDADEVQHLVIMDNAIEIVVLNQIEDDENEQQSDPTIPASNDR